MAGRFSDFRRDLLLWPVLAVVFLAGVGLFRLIRWIFG